MTVTVKLILNNKRMKYDEGPWANFFSDSEFSLLEWSIKEALLNMTF